MRSAQRTHRARKSVSGRDPGGRTSSGAGLAWAGEVFITQVAAAPEKRAERAARLPTSRRSFVPRAGVKVHARAPSGHSAVQLKQVPHPDGGQCYLVVGLAPPAT